MGYVSKLKSFSHLYYYVHCHPICFTAIEAERLIFTLVDPIQTVEQLRLDQVSGWGAADCLGRVLAAQVV